MTWLLFLFVSILGFFYVTIRADDEVLRQIKEKILNDHNKYRKQHYVPFLKLNDQLSKAAKKSAVNLVFPRMYDEYRPSTRFGENIWRTRGFEVDEMLTNETANPVDWWYSKIAFYPNGYFKEWSPFTQLIWKSSKHLGCGISYRHDNICVICYYHPPGNVQSEYENNVFTIDGAPWGTSGKSGGRSGKFTGDDAEFLADDYTKTSSGREDRKELSTPYWIYGLSFVIILLVGLMVFLVTRLYYQKSS